MTDRPVPTQRTFLGLPTHVVVMLGASTAGYALMLAGVTGLQSHTEGLLMAARQPAVDGVARLAAGHDDLSVQLRAAQDAYNRTVESYTTAGGSLDALNTRLGVLASLVGEIDGVSRSMPTTVKIPVVHRSVGAVGSTTQATTGASGTK